MLGMNKFVWASPHKPTTLQLDSLHELGNSVEFMVDLAPDLFNRISQLSFDTDLVALSNDVIRFVEEHDCVLVQPAGNPAFHFTLGRRLDSARVLFAFSKRVSVDVEQPDGSVRKTAVFTHEGWV